MEKFHCVGLGEYSGKVWLRFPEHADRYYISKHGCLIDFCIVEEIKFLWDNDILTMGSCCGHGKDVGFVNVFHEDVQKMIDLNYERLLNGHNEDSFILKSKHYDVWQLKGIK